VDRTTVAPATLLGVRTVGSCAGRRRARSAVLSGRTLRAVVVALRAPLGGTTVAPVPLLRTTLRPAAITTGGALRTVAVPLRAPLGGTTVAPVPLLRTTLRLTAITTGRALRTVSRPRTVAIGAGRTP
jgi:hypothetical protein